MIKWARGIVTKEKIWGHPSVGQEIEVTVAGQTRSALNYQGMTGRVWVGDEVLINTTAQEMGLGTGGVDFVIANLSKFGDGPHSELRHTGMFRDGKYRGHIIKGRYTPLQQAVLTLEEQDKYADVWEKTLDGFPVLVGQLHSQIAPAAAALHLGARRKIAYVMTDAAALPIEFSKLVHELKRNRLVNLTITCGQAFGGNWETVTLHSALLAAKYLGECDAAIVCQGPGNAGTGTKYGFSGIEQAQNLDIAHALGGTPIAIARMSSADARARHQGLSHHTRTSLALAYAPCLVPIPEGEAADGIPERHTVVSVDGVDKALLLLAQRGVRVTTMGRGIDDDPLFFRAAAAAGMPSVLERKLA